MCNLVVLFIHFIATRPACSDLTASVPWLPSCFSSSTNSGARVIERIITQYKTLSVAYG
jgi:hypothetical protein